VHGVLQVVLASLAFEVQPSRIGEIMVSQFPSSTYPFQVLFRPLLARKMYPSYVYCQDNHSSLNNILIFITTQLAYCQISKDQLTLRIRFNLIRWWVEFPEFLLKRGLLQP
jgi:hypothetical protein